jgi:hypothetical protein
MPQDSVVLSRRTSLADAKGGRHRAGHPDQQGKRWGSRSRRPDRARLTRLRRVPCFGGPSSYGWFSKRTLFGRESMFARQEVVAF